MLLIATSHNDIPVALLLIQLASSVPGKQQMMTEAVDTHVSDLVGVPGYKLQLGPALTVGSHLGSEPTVRHLCLYYSAFQVYKTFYLK